MELLERYLQAVKFWLPRAQQDDIVAELSEDVRSQMEEQEAGLGRKLNEAEIASILKQRGRPLLVANRYLPQQSLIGPVLFPVYRFVLKIVILCYLAPSLLVWIGMMSLDPGYHSAHSVAGALIGVCVRIWLTALIEVGVVTIIFAVLERLQSQSRFLENWDPRRLRPVHDPNRIPRYSSTFELAAIAVFIVWWVSSLWSQTIFDRASIRIVLTPAWRIFFWTFLLLALANIGLSAVNLFRPYWTRLRSGIRLAVDCAGSGVFCWLLKAHLLAEISAPHLSSARAAEIANSININMSRSFPVVVIACVLIVALADVGRLVRLKYGRTGLVQGVAAIT